MIFDLTDEDRGALETIRKNRGHRSHAETLRELIRQAASSGLPTPEQREAIVSEGMRLRREAALASALMDVPSRDAPIGDTVKVRVPVFERKPFNPQQKPTKGKK